MHQPRPTSSHHRCQLWYRETPLPLLHYMALFFFSSLLYCSNHSRPSRVPVMTYSSPTNVMVSKPWSSISRKSSVTRKYCRSIREKSLSGNCFQACKRRNTAAYFTLASSIARIVTIFLLHSQPRNRPCCLLTVYKSRVFEQVNVRAHRISQISCIK